MKSIISCVAFLLIVTAPFAKIEAQDCPTRQNFRKRAGIISELSIGVGGAHYFGDLNTYNISEHRIIGELHRENMYVAMGANYRFYFSKFINPRISFFYTRLRGSDQHNEIHKDFSAAWFRRYRNLSFRTDLLELMLSSEINFFGFEPGNKRKWISPFFTAGFGFIFFDPKAPYSSKWMREQIDNPTGANRDPLNYKYDSWIRLQPLGTEGQGLPGYGEKYKLIQPVYSFGLGIKCNLSSSVTLSWQVNHHFTFTDYLDDVSTVYPNINDFYKYYDYEKATLISNLSVRSKELDPAGSYSYITTTGQQRGGPKYKDSYLSSMLTVGFKLNNKLQKSKSQNPKRIENKQAGEENKQPADFEKDTQPERIKLYRNKKDRKLYKEIYFNKRQQGRGGISGI
jgi:hypothetical protein